MPASANGIVLITTFWTTFKAVAITGKSLPVQYDSSDSAFYTIFAFDGNICYTCVIWTGSISQTALSAGYTQIQNDSDKTDFTTNYLPTANKNIDAAVKPASTAAIATDPSIVTAFSPNSPLPTGSNTIGAVTQASGPWTINQTQINGNAVTTLVAGEQKVAVEGLVADGAAVSGNPVLTAGFDGTNVQTKLTDTSGRQVTVGAAADGAAVTGNPVLMGGQDGTNAQSILTDTTGRQVMVGASADGAAVTGNPILIGGQDGTNTQSILTDTTGRQIMIGAAADGTAITGNPVLIAGQDGTNTQSIATDGYGRIQVIITGSGGGSSQVEGRAADGATPVGNPVLVGGYDGANTQTILTDTSGRIVIAPSGASTVSGFSFGDVPLSSITTSVVRRTTYTEQSTNATRSIASANANDSSAGTGARQVKITYYDQTGAGPFTTTVTTNGVTAVATSVSDICFIEKMEVVSVGSTGSNVGIITLFVNNAGGGGTIGTIAATDNRTFWAHHYTPISKTTFITSVSAVINGGAAIYILKAKTLNVSTAPEAQVSDFIRESAQAAIAVRNYGTPIQVVGPARILMYVTTEANTSLTYRGSFDYYDE
jgi:hypothetical protein